MQRHRPANAVDIGAVGNDSPDVHLRLDQVQDRMAVKKAHYELQEVQALVAKGKVRWTNGKATLPLSDDYGSNWIHNGARIVLQLTTQDFSANIEQQGETYDIYGTRYDGKGWFVKLRIEDFLDSAQVPRERVRVLSCHKLTRPMRTGAGEVMP